MGDLGPSKNQCSLIDKDTKYRPSQLGRRHGDRFLPEVNSQIIRIRITVPNQLLSANASNIIALTSFSSDSLRTASTEFASYAARWSHWRVHWMEGIFDPVWPAATKEFSTGKGHSQLYAAPIWGIEAVNPSTAGEVLSITACKVLPTHKPFKVRVTWKGYMDDHLWCPTNAAQPTDQTLS